MGTGKTQPVFKTSEFEILFNFKQVPDEGLAEGLAKAIDRIDQDILFKEYYRLQKNAPKRFEKGKEIFPTGHKGILPGRQGDFERHLEGALWNQCFVETMPPTSAGNFKLLDYQFPLYDQKPDLFGKVDLVGISSGRDQFTTIELKVPDSQDRPTDTPLGALIQALRYTAIVEANLEYIKVGLLKKKADNPNDRRWHVPTLADKPGIMLLAPVKWWNWFDGSWKKDFDVLLVNIKEELGIITECYSIEDISGNDIVWTGNKPDLPTKTAFSALP